MPLLTPSFTFLSEWQQFEMFKLERTNLNDKSLRKEGEVFGVQPVENVGKSWRSAH